MNSYDFAVQATAKSLTESILQGNANALDDPETDKIFRYAVKGSAYTLYMSYSSDGINFHLARQDLIDEINDILGL